jgi:hypothetical protein
MGGRPTLKSKTENYPLPDTSMNLSVICVDFDGVLAEDTWPSPEIGDPIEAGLDMVEWYATHEFAVVIFTARPEAHKMALWGWLAANGLRGLIYDVVCDKPRAALYIDDKARRWPL